MPASPEERYQEWLERMEIPIEDQTDIETFKSYLKDEFAITGEAQIGALWGATAISDTLADMGIHAVIVHYSWGNSLRYGVQGMPGLWGWETIQIIMEAEAYE